MEYDYLPYLTTEGIIFMAAGWAFVIGLVSFTFYKVLKGTTDLEKEAEEKEIGS
jgi:hypothetical protein